MSAAARPSGRSVLVALALPALCGCSVPTEHNDWSSYTGPGAEYFQREELPPLETLADPIEPFNRGMSALNHGLIVGVVDPVARVYRLVVPAYARSRISNFGTNLSYPKHLVNSLLQGKWSGAGVETLRFLTNTTIGLAGLFDPATSFGLGSSRENFERTLGTWGWSPYAYFVFPLYGPATGRSVVGDIGDTATEPQSYLFPASQILSFNNFSGAVDTYRSFVRTNYDPYTLSRYLWTFARSERDAVHAEEYTDQETSSLQTLGLLSFEPQDARFARRARRRSVPVPSTGEKLPYNLWLQDEPAPLVFVLPGLGGHRESATTAALAELAFRAGHSAVAISNAMNFEFMERAATAPVPGYAPADAADVHAALDAIARDIDARHPGRVTARALLGISLGACHTLFIAAAETRSQGLVRFDRYVAIAPPVRLLHGVEQLDRFYNAPLEWPEAERSERVENTLVKVLELTSAQQGEGSALPFDRVEAEFLIGLAFRLTLHDVIHSSQSRRDMGVLATPMKSWRRAGVYREILEFSYMEYFYAFVLPWLQEHDDAVSGPEDVIRLTDLRSITPGLARNERIRVITNANDFLYDRGDLAFLQRTFSDGRIRVFDEGGHLGNLHADDVQQAVERALSRIPLSSLGPR